MVLLGSGTRGFSDARRLWRQKGIPASATTAARTAVSDRFHCRKPEHDSGWAICLAHMADEQRDRRFDRWDRRRPRQWISERIADRLHYVPPCREGCRGNARSNGTADGDPSSASATNDSERDGRRLVQPGRKSTRL